MKTDAESKSMRAAVKAHPVGAVAGAVGGAAAGAVVGIAAGPVGSAFGAVAGAVIGGVLGRGAGQAMQPNAEDDHWHTTYSTRPYVGVGAPYDDYGPAYRYGADAYRRLSTRGWDDAQAELAAGWDAARGRSRLGWNEAMPAARDAWLRAEAATQRVSTEADRDV